MANPIIEEDTCQQVLIRGKWVQVPDSAPKNASGQLERDQHFINELTLQPKAHCMRIVSGTPIMVQSPSPLIQRLISSTNVHSATFCNECTFCRLFAFIYFLHLLGVPKMVPIKMLVFGQVPMKP